MQRSIFQAWLTIWESLTDWPTSSEGSQPNPHRFGGFSHTRWEADVFISPSPHILLFISLYVNFPHFVNCQLVLTSKHVPLSFSLWLSFTLFPSSTPTHFPSSSPFPASQCLSRYLGLSQTLRPPPETSPSASPFPGAHRRNTSIMGRPKVHRNPVTWPERPSFHERHAALMVRWNCKLYGLHPTAPVLSHEATKKQGNSVKWSVFGNSQLTKLWQTLGKKKDFCVWP